MFLRTKVRLPIFPAKSSFHCTIIFIVNLSDVLKDNEELFMHITAAVTWLNDKPGRMLIELLRGLKIKPTSFPVNLFE